MTILKSNSFNEEKQIKFYEDETEMIKEKIKQIDKDKQRLRHEIINYKKKTDLIKENLKKENIKINTLIHEMEYLIDNNKNK